MSERSTITRGVNEEHGGDRGRAYGRNRDRSRNSSRNRDRGRSRSRVRRRDRSERKRRRKREESKGKRSRFDLRVPSDLFKDLLQVCQSKSNVRDSFPVLANAVPEFDPLCKEQTITNWLEKVEECSEIYDWSDKQKIHYALPKLIGHAKVWYQGLPTLRHTWAEWKTLLTESFPSTENYAELLTDMLNRRAKFGESLELYYFSKINLLNRCKIFGKAAVDCIVYGIDDRGVRVGAQAAKFEKPEQALEFFKTIKGQGNGMLLKKDFDRDTRNDITSNVVKDGRSVIPFRSDKNDIVCYNCKLTGHPSFKCPKPIIRCTKCYMFGHKINECPKELVNESKERNVQN